MSERITNGEFITDEQATLAMYNTIPEVLSKHFANFRDLPGIHPAEEDLRLAQKFAGVKPQESLVVEMGCGDGRDATDFIPLSGKYVGVGPAEGELAIAQERFKSIPNATFQLGRFQDFKYPEGTNVIMSVNSILHVSQGDLKTSLENLGDSLMPHGVAHFITKTREGDSVREVYPDNFPDSPETLTMPGRVFTEHSRSSLLETAEKVGLTVVHTELTPVTSKPWDWFSYVVQKP